MLTPHQAIKLHLVVTVVLTQCAALFVDRGVPYFPIEISRTAAAGYWSGLVFRTGILALAVTLLLCKLFTVPYAFVWCSLVVIAFFDDVTHWVLHMVGVAALGLSVVTMLAYSPHRSRDLVTLLLAFSIYVARPLLKVLVVLILETPRVGPLWAARKQLMTHIFHVTKDVMYYGQTAGRQYSDTTILVFKLGGVLQWVVFWLFSELLQ